ncbi:MAG TPA: zinc ribbon domain-containing protein [Xanthomonadales bacterium]|nr:zinc ribbon domain-containing protein [Xanthomonadales bacterium]
MPIYEYRCQSCGHELERLQRMSEPVLTDCPSCGKARLQRLISAAGFRLKGAGWYETDFKQGNKRNLVDAAGSKAEGAAPAEASSASGETAGKADSPASSAASTPKAADGSGKSKTSGGNAADSA